MIYPPLVPTSKLLFDSYNEIILGLLEMVFPKTFGNDISLYFDMFALHKMIFPRISPEIIPPSTLSHNAPTAFVCSLYTLEQKCPFQ